MMPATLVVEGEMVNFHSDLQRPFLQRERSICLSEYELCFCQLRRSRSYTPSCILLRQKREETLLSVLS